MPPLQDPVEEATRIMTMAEQRDLVLRLFGGVAFHLRCPSANHRSLQRAYVDIDFMAHASQDVNIAKLFLELGYVPRERFNALHGSQRMIFEDIPNQRRVDIFLDIFHMCHNFNLMDRMEVDKHTISLADMLATKLQIVEINEKDVKDILSILIDHDVGSGDLPDVLNGKYLAELCADDWGVYKTFTTNLDKLPSFLNDMGLDESQKSLVRQRSLLLRRFMDDVPKSMKWKLRARIGERISWYALPEADREVVTSASTLDRAPMASS